jgi:hypothetical protein
LKGIVSIYAGGREQLTKKLYPGIFPINETWLQEKLRQMQSAILRIQEFERQLDLGLEALHGKGQ